MFCIFRNDLVCVKGGVPHKAVVEIDIQVCGIAAATATANNPKLNVVLFTTTCRLR